MDEGRDRMLVAGSAFTDCVVGRNQLFEPHVRLLSKVNYRTAK
jgi:hypothetical protein